MKKTFAEFIKMMEGELPKLVTPEMTMKEGYETNNKIPKNQDPAYTIYNGQKYVGVLTRLKEGWKRNITGILYVPRSGYDHMGKDSIEVGHDDPIVWDEDANMWYAPAGYI